VLSGGDLIFLFLHKKLVIDVSSEEIARVTSILEENGIDYGLRTVRARGSIGTALDSLTYARSNLAMYKGSRGNQYVYMVYVRRRDYERAKDLVCGD
jgi:hypothetical protein